jgi:hypothetical protein
MSIIMEINPFEFFTDTRGDALDAGYIWVGEINKDPRQYPVSVFYDSALTIPAAMPLRTSNGYIVRNGTPTFLYINGNYSILVQDKNHSQIYYVPDFLMIGNDSAVSQAQFNGLSDTTDPAKGDALIGVKQPVTGAVGRTQHAKNAEFLSVTDFQGVDPTGVSDSTAGLTLALATGRSLYFPNGDYLVSTPLTMNSSGQQLRGDGPFKSTIKASGAFIGSGVLIMGNKAVTTVTGAVGMRDLEIDCSGVDGLMGIEAYGLRDGTVFRSVYVTNNKNAPGIKTNMAGDGLGAASGLMCEGVQFQNCHVITNQDMVNTFYWQLDGLFEAQLIGCKALGSSVSTVSGTSGYRLGGISQTRGVALIACSAGNLPTGNNFGIRYGQWARECWDQFTTFENIKGSGVYFHGTQISGSLLPAICRSLDPRPYNVTDAGVLDPLYLFGDANACYAGTISYYNSTKVWARFDDLQVNQFNNVVEILAGTVPTSVVGSIIQFNAATANSNMVIGFSSDSSLSRKAITFNKGGHTETYAGNGYSEQHDGSFDTFNLGTPNKMRMRNVALDTIFSVDGTALAASRTNVSMLSNKAGTTVLDQVRIGAADSGGVGFRALIIPN